MKQPLLEIKNVSKRFDMTQALHEVSLSLFPGEIHTLVGENGAGKSTLIKIMTGVFPQDQGAILHQGEPIRIQNAQQAQSHGIAAIYQEPMVFPDLNVAENIFISHQDRGAIVRWGKMYEDAEAILSQLGIRLDVRAPARGLTLAAQQAVEIARALSLHVKILIMDEPTASLSAHEVAQLFKVAKALRHQGVAILFISHRLDEVFEITDRVTVLRDGKGISTHPIGEVTRQSLIRDMVGREMGDYFDKTNPHPKGELLMSVRGLGKENTFSNIHFDIHKGEVLGLAGLVGSSRTNVGLALFGIEPADAGQITFGGKNLRLDSPKKALEHGIAYLTEDRRQLGLTLPMSIASNISLPMLRQYTSKLGLVQQRAEAAMAEQYRQKLAIRAPSVQHEVGKLSGGNQQKVMLSKWLNAKPQLFILDEPTRGIDVGAKAEVHQRVRELAAQGLALIFISSDLPEVLAMSDRILVMREGRQMGIFHREEATQELIMTAAMGQNEPTLDSPAMGE